MSESLIDELGTAWSQLVRDAESFFPSATGVVPYADLPDAPAGPGDDAHVIHSLDALAAYARPAFVDLERRFPAVLGPIGYKAVRAETLRTNERQAWLYGIGRRYKAQGRTGIVTNASAATGKHVKGEAGDYDYVAIDPQMPPNVAALTDALVSVADMMGDALDWGGTWVALKDPRHWELR